MKQWAAKCKKTELLIQRFLTNCLNNFTCPFTASPTTQAPASRTSPPPPGTSSSSSSSSDSTHRGTQSRPRRFCVIFRRWKCERLQISSNRVVFCQIEMDRVAKWKEPGTPLTGALHQGLEYFVSSSEGGSVKDCRYNLTGWCFARLTWTGCPNGKNLGLHSQGHSNKAFRRWKCEISL